MIHTVHTHVIPGWKHPSGQPALRITFFGYQKTCFWTDCLMQSRPHRLCDRKFISCHFMSHFCHFFHTEAVIAESQHQGREGEGAGNSAQRCDPTIRIPPYPPKMNGSTKQSLDEMVLLTLLSVLCIGVGGANFLSSHLTHKPCLIALWFQVWNVPYVELILLLGCQQLPYQSYIAETKLEHHTLTLFQTYHSDSFQTYERLEVQEQLSLTASWFVISVTAWCLRVVTIFFNRSSARTELAIAIHLSTRLLEEGLQNPEARCAHIHTHI